MNIVPCGPVGCYTGLGQWFPAGELSPWRPLMAEPAVMDKDWTPSVLEKSLLLTPFALYYSVVCTNLGGAKAMTVSEFVFLYYKVCMLCFLTCTPLLLWVLLGNCRWGSERQMQWVENSVQHMLLAHMQYGLWHHKLRQSTLAVIILTTVCSLTLTTGCRRMHFFCGIRGQSSSCCGNTGHSTQVTPWSSKY